MKRYYLVPMISVSPTGDIADAILNVQEIRGPAHFHSRAADPDPELKDVRWEMKSFGVLDVGLMAADVDEAQAAYLDSLPDVLAFPADIDQPVSLRQIGSFRVKLEAFGIPAIQITADDHYRDVLIAIIDMFSFMQRVQGAMGETRTKSGVHLAAKLDEMPASVAAAIERVYNSKVYSKANLTPDASLRQILRDVADTEATRRA